VALNHNSGTEVLTGNSVQPINTTQGPNASDGAKISAKNKRLTLHQPESKPGASLSNTIVMSLLGAAFSVRRLESGVWHAISWL
jgi:hypothetical protein